MMYDVTAQTRLQINQLFAKNSYVSKNKLSERILKSLLDGGHKESFCMYTQRSLDMLLRHGLIRFVDSTCYITEYGRYVITANTLNMRFLSFCLFSEIYTMHSKFPNPSCGSYPLTRFASKVESLYAKSTVHLEALRLTNLGYIKKRSKNKRFIPDDVYLTMKKYDHTLKDAQKWFVDTMDKIDNLIRLDPNIISGTL